MGDWRHFITMVIEIFKNFNIGYISFIKIEMLHYKITPKYFSPKRVDNIPGPLSKFVMCFVQNKYQILYCNN